MQGLSELLTRVPFLRKGEPQFLVNLIRTLPPNPRILEIGSFRGLSAVLMAKNRKDAKITTIDPHIGITGNSTLFSSPFIVNTNIQKYGLEKQITHIPLASQEYIPEEMVDLLFIDGDHTYEGVMYDYTKFSPYVKQGGYIIFHDYGEISGVTKFCTKLILIHKQIYKTMFVIKK